MADQFDVFRNPATRSSHVPYVVVVQSNRFRASRHRVVVPLVQDDLHRPATSDVAPRLRIAGVQTRLDPLQTAYIDRELLGEAVATLQDDDDRIIQAMDVLLSRA